MPHKLSELFSRFCFLWSVIFILSLSLFFIACNISEPEVPYNSEAYPPSSALLYFSSVRSGQRLAGAVTIAIDSSLVNFKVSRVKLIVGSYEENISSKWSVTLNTAAFPNGETEIALCFYQAHKPHGLLNLYDAPSLILKNKIIIDNTPPVPVKLTVISQDKGRSALLQWNQTTSQNFRAYLICRRMYGYPQPVIDTIYDINTTSYIDNTINNISGAEIEYNVQVCTEYDLRNGAASNTCSFFYCRAFTPGAFYTDFSLPATNPKLLDLYYLTSTQLLAYSISDYSLSKKYKLPSWMSLGSMTFTVSKDGSEIYLLSSAESKIYVIDARTFTLKSSFPFTNTFPGGDVPKLMAGKPGQIILYPSDCILRVIRTTDGSLVKSRQLYEYGFFYNMAVSNDGSKLYASCSYTSSDDRIKYKLSLIDLNSTGLTVVKENAENNYSSLYTDPLGQYLLDIPISNESPSYNIARIRNANTLEEINQLSPQVVGANIGKSGGLITENNIYVMYNSSPAGMPDVLGSTVVEFDRNSFSQKRYCATARIASVLLPSADHQELYANKSHSPELDVLVLK